jgi:hypothetical protein
MIGQEKGDLLTQVTKRKKMKIKNILQMAVKFPSRGNMLNRLKNIYY